MPEQRSFFATSRGLGPHASRRGLLQAGLAIGTLGLGGDHWRAWSSPASRCR